MAPWTGRSVPESILPTIYSAVGFLVVNWALVEHSLDTWSTVIFHLAEGKRVNHQMQRNLGGKLEFLRRCFKRIGALAPYSEEALQLLTTAERLSLTRHFVVHGALAHYEPQDGTIIFSKLDLVDDYTRHKINELTIPLEKLTDEGMECLKIFSPILELSVRLINAFVPEEHRHKLSSTIRR